MKIWGSDRKVWENVTESSNAMIIFLISWPRVNASDVKNKLWCESTTNPVPVLRIAASRGFLELIKKFNQVSPWSLHTFPENFMQIGPAVFS